MGVSHRKACDGRYHAPELLQRGRVNAGRNDRLDLAQGRHVLAEFHRVSTRGFDREGDGEPKTGEASVKFDLFHLASLGVFQCHGKSMKTRVAGCR